MPYKKANSGPKERAGRQSESYPIPSRLKVISCGRDLALWKERFSLLRGYAAQMLDNIKTREREVMGLLEGKTTPAEMKRIRNGIQNQRDTLSTMIARRNEAWHMVSTLTNEQKEKVDDTPAV